VYDAFQKAKDKPGFKAKHEAELIWRHGRMYAPGELMERAFEEPFDPKYYTDYWERKMTDIYGL